MAAITHRLEMRFDAAFFASPFEAVTRAAFVIQMGDRKHDFTLCPLCIFAVAFNATARPRIRLVQAALSLTFTLTLRSLVANALTYFFPVWRIFGFSGHPFTFLKSLPQTQAFLILSLS